jgi:hypothetical protein
MPLSNDKKYGWVSECGWRYKPSWLKEIAENYYAYEGAEVGSEKLDRKIDFDMALKSLSNRRRKAIELYIDGWEDITVETDYQIQSEWGFYNVASFRKSSFGLMADWLNGKRK